MALTDSLIAYWKLDEASGTRNDSHGANHLTDNNTVGSAAGKINNGADLDSTTTEYLSRADNADLSLGSDTDFSFTCWLKTTQVEGSANAIQKHNDAGESSGNGCEYNLWFSFARPRFTVGNNSSFATCQLNTQIHDDAWHYVVVWHSSVDDKLFIQLDNGTPAEQAWSGGTQDGGNTFSLGSSLGGTSSYDGIIDEVGFWKRVLTTQERTDLYNGGAGLPYSGFGPSAALILMGEQLN